MKSGVTSLCTWDLSLNKCVIDQDISDWNCIQGFIKGFSFSCNTKRDIRLRIYEKNVKKYPMLLMEKMTHVLIELDRNNCIFEFT